MASWIVFASAGDLGYMVPRDSGVRVNSKWNIQPDWQAKPPKLPRLPSTYPPFNGLVYALDAYLPVIELGQDEDWEPSAIKTAPAINAQPEQIRCSMAALTGKLLSRRLASCRVLGLEISRMDICFALHRRHEWRDEERMRRDLLEHHSAAITAAL